MREAGRKDRDSATSCIRVLDRFNPERAALLIWAVSSHRLRVNEPPPLQNNYEFRQLPNLRPASARHVRVTGKRTPNEEAERRQSGMTWRGKKTVPPKLQEYAGGTHAAHRWTMCDGSLRRSI